MMNRAALVLKYKQPALDWINKVDETAQLTLEDVNEDGILYLVDEAYGENPRLLLEKGYLNLWEYELAGWYEEETVWPQKRTPELFEQWFDIEVHSIVEDFMDGPLLEED